MKNRIGIIPVVHHINGENCYIHATKIRYEPISLLKISSIRDENNKPVGILKTVDEMPAGIYVVRSDLTFDGYSDCFYNRRELMNLLVPGYLLAARYLRLCDLASPIAYRVWWFDKEKGWRKL